MRLLVFRCGGACPLPKRACRGRGDHSAAEGLPHAVRRPHVSPLLKPATQRGRRCCALRMFAWAVRTPGCTPGSSPQGGGRAEVAGVPSARASALARRDSWFSTGRAPGSSAGPPRPRALCQPPHSVPGPRRTKLPALVQDPPSLGSRPAPAELCVCLCAGPRPFRHDDQEGPSRLPCSLASSGTTDSLPWSSPPPLPRRTQYLPQVARPPPSTSTTSPPRETPAPTRCAAALPAPGPGNRQPLFCLASHRNGILG